MTLQDMPRFGQFAAIWMWKGEIWSSTHRWIDGVLHVYDEYECRWDVEANDAPDAYRNLGAVYMVGTPEVYDA